MFSDPVVKSSETGNPAVELTVVGSEAVPLELLPPPDTVAVFVTLAAALLATFTARLMAG
jgi:hypothetical protein